MHIQSLLNVNVNVDVRTTVESKRAGGCLDEMQVAGECSGYELTP